MLNVWASAVHTTTAQRVVERGVPEVIDAMDKGELSISAAAEDCRGELYRGDRRDESTRVIGASEIFRASENE